MLIIFSSFELSNFMHVIDDFVLFVSSLNSTILNIDNMVCKDKKIHVLEA